MYGGLHIGTHALYAFHVKTHESPLPARPSTIADDSLIEQQINWPKSKFSSPFQKMKLKIDSIFLGFSTSSWAAPLKERSLRALERLAKQHAEDVEGCEFQMLVERSQIHVDSATALTSLCFAKKHYEADATTTNLVALSRALEPVILARKALTTQPLYGKLYLLQVFPMTVV